MADDDTSTDLSGTEARAGATPGVTRYVLAISVVLIVIIFAAILLVR